MTRQAAPVRVVPHIRGNAVRAENGDRAVGHFLEVFDENGSPCRQFIDYKPVVDDFLPYVNRCAEPFQRNFDNIDCSNNTGAKASRFWK